MKSFVLLLPVFLSFFLVSCKPDVGSPVVDRKTMVPLLADIHLTQSLMDLENSPPQNQLQRDKYYKNVLDAHHVSEADFDSTIAWYARNAGEMQKLYKEVCDTLDARNQDFLKKH